MESKALVKSTNINVACRLFARTPSRILRMVNICEVVDLFLRKPFWFFLSILSKVPHHVAKWNLSTHQYLGKYWRFDFHEIRRSSTFCDCCSWMKAYFPGRWMGHCSPHEWSARSPNLSPCDFFSLKLIKGVKRLYQTNNSGRTSRVNTRSYVFRPTIVPGEIS